MKNNLLVLLAFSFIFSLSAQNKTPEAFSFIAFGDMPYVLPQDYARFENVIKAINNESNAFSVDVGDIKSSGSPCSEEYYSKILNYFDQFNKPLIYIPGDNEWTDCGKKDAGAYDAEERLDVIRKMFFKNRSSFGREKINLTSQSLNADYSKFVENNRWDYGNVSFATVHVVGSNNNFLATSKNGNREFFERQKADLAWLDEVLKNAKEKNSLAMVIVIHADMFYPGKDLKEASGFNEIKKKLKDIAIDFKKPVLLINGDSHEILMDKPLTVEPKSEKTIWNFTRLQVPGEANMNAVKIHIDPRSPAVFQFEELIVAGN